MKIRKLTPDNYPKVAGLLRQTFPARPYVVRVFENLHKHGKIGHEWVGIQTNTVIAYIAFSHAYNGSAVCGLHLAPLVVKAEFQHQGIGSELLRFALRQEVIKDNSIFVLGNPDFYQKFGFTLCGMPTCPFAKKKAHFLSIRNNTASPFTVGYEAEFNLGP